MNKTTIHKIIILKSVILGIIAIILTDAFFFINYPSAWVFFIIPAFMAFCLTKFVKYPPEHEKASMMNE